MKRIIFFTVLIILVITLHLFGILSPVETIVYKAATPVGGVFQGFFNFLNETYHRYLGKKDFEEENRRLRERVRDLVAERAETNALQEENASLKKMLSFLEEKKYESIAVRVVGKTTEGDISTIIINKGEKDGVKRNLPVVAESGVIVGKILETTPQISTVLLLSDGSSKVAGMIQNNTKTIGMISGGYGLGVRMELIPQTETVEPDEIVITSGLELEIPRGLLVGTVESVLKEPHAPFQTVIMKPLIDYNKLDFVSVLLEI